MSVGYDMDQSGLDLPGDIDHKPADVSYPPHPTDEEIVVAATASVEQSEPAPVVQAFSVTPDVSDRELREEEEREFQRKQEEEREFLRNQEEEREFLRNQEEEREFRRRQEEERELRLREDRAYQVDLDMAREKEQDRDRQEKDEYMRQMEQREYERRQYEENRRSYDGGDKHRDERKPYIPPGVKVLPGTLPPVVSLKKADSGERNSPRDETAPGDARLAVQLRHVERDSEAEQYDERIGVKVSDLFDIGKDIQGGGEYLEDGGRAERSDQRRYGR